MEDDSLQDHQRKDSVHLPVKGMESVLATVSGYQGAMRFNLIKLIYRSGASYVGNMSKSITHLVSWKFEGRKYEVAKKFKIKVVSHRWIEECVKQGRRVPEGPFTLRCGQEMGPLCSSIIKWTDQVVSQSKTIKKDKERIIDVECEDENGASLSDLICLDEMQNNNGSNGLPRKTIKRNTSKDLASSSRYSHNESGSRNMELQDVSSSRSAYERPRKRNSISSETQPRCRRLIKKHGGQNDVVLTSNSDQDCDEMEVLSENTYHLSCQHIESDGDRHHQTSIPRCTADIRHFMNRRESNNNYIREVEEVENVDDETPVGQDHDAGLSSSAALRDVPETIHEDSIKNDSGHKLPESTDLSCVICWTDYSNTRGVLQCGHRFCFSCIQNWADHMASRRKPSTCPLCKASFICITKVDEAASSDQKIYSQTIPQDSLKSDLYIVADENRAPPNNPATQVCCQCYSREPEDLLVRCNFCQFRCVHSYCLDPPLFPWTCVHCKDLQVLYHHNR